MGSVQAIARSPLAWAAAIVPRIVGGLLGLGLTALLMGERSWEAMFDPLAMETSTWLLTALPTALLGGASLALASWLLPPVGTYAAR